MIISPFCNQVRPAPDVPAVSTIKYLGVLKNSGKEQEKVRAIIYQEEYEKKRLLLLKETLFTMLP